MTTASQLLTADELAERWRTTKAGVYRMTREGIIPAGVVVKLGRYYRYRLPGIETFEEQGGELSKEAA
ncbi:MAG TPA: helix-turn-helix domain-containing protein [Solirubrobacterales bacterium]